MVPINYANVDGIAKAMEGNEIVVATLGFEALTDVQQTLIAAAAKVAFPLSASVHSSFCCVCSVPYRVRFCRRKFVVLFPLNLVLNIKLSGNRSVAACDDRDRVFC